MTSRTSHVPRDGPFGGIRSSTCCISSWKLSIALFFCNAVPLADGRSMSVASRSGLKCSTSRLRSWISARRPCLRCSVFVSMSPISLVAGDSEHNLFLDGRSCVSDVQDESSRASFQWVCRSVLARSSRLPIFAWTSSGSMNVAPSSEQTGSGPSGITGRSCAL